MGSPKRKMSNRKLTGLFLVGGILVLLSIPQPMEILGDIQKANRAVAIFYGSIDDKNLANSIVEKVGIEAYYYNITQTLMNSSFTFSNETIVAVWWINELAVSIDLTFLGDLDQWKQAGRGLFILNRYFTETPLQDLYYFGITAYAPVLYPFNELHEKQELNLKDTEKISINLTQNEFELNCSAGWVEISNRSQIIAEITAPENETCLSGLKSGLWLADSRFLIGSFSIKMEWGASASRFSIQTTQSAQSENFINLLGNLVQVTLGSFPSGGSNLSLEFGDLEQIASIGLIVLISIISFLVLMKLGVLSKIRDFTLPILVSLFLFIAHIAYSPQKRRINEDELLENELRGQIVSYLELKGEQGAHLREIQREVGCGISSLLWHLQALDDFNMITHEKIGKYHIFYLTGLKSVQTTEAALALKSDVAKDLCRILINHKKPVSLSKISQKIDVHHSSVQHHIKKLADLGIIIILKEKKRSQYIISPKRVPWLRSHLEDA